MINIENVESVYNGINGKCCCGCSGKHSNTHKAISRKVNLFNKNINDVQVDGNHAALIVGTRVHVIYFKTDLRDLS